MKSFKGIALLMVLTSLLFSGCAGVDKWFKREHALKPLKEQYWNGELSFTEYREKKKMVIADLERTDYKTAGEQKKALREARGDTHTIETVLQSLVEDEDDEIILVQDQKMIEDEEEALRTSEVAPFAPDAAETAAATTSGEIDYGMLSRSMGTSTQPRQSSVVLTNKPATVEPGEELITDSKDVKWTKDHDGVVTYEDPAEDALSEPVIKEGETSAPPPVKTVPAEEATPEAESAHTEAEPAHAEEEPIILDLGDF